MVRDIIGKDNSIVIGQGSYLEKVRIRIRGNNNQIIIGPGCYIGKGCSVLCEGNNLTILIGQNTTFTQMCHLCAQEDGMSIQIGEDCMFSNHIIVRTSDSHPIYDKVTGERINPAKSVVVGNHVWIAPDTKIMKGAFIHDGSIIGSNTFVSREIPSYSLAVGQPARVIRENINWTREKLF